MKLEMKRQDLIELYQLASLYSRTYGSQSTESLLKELNSRYQEKYGADISDESNPRDAGRKKKYDEKTDRRIMQMHGRGCSVREIAQETGCSVGYVQSVIRK